MPLPQFALLTTMAEGAPFSSHGRHAATATADSPPVPAEVRRPRPDGAAPAAPAAARCIVAVHEPRPGRVGASAPRCAARWAASTHAVHTGAPACLRLRLRLRLWLRLRSPRWRVCVACPRCAHKPHPRPMRSRTPTATTTDDAGRKPGGWPQATRPRVRARLVFSAPRAFMQSSSSARTQAPTCTAGLKGSRLARAAALGPRADVVEGAQGH